MRWLTTMWMSVMFGLPFSLSASAQSIEYISSTLWSGAADLEVVGNYAYCAFPDGLGILDVSDPRKPVFFSQVDLHFRGENGSGGPVLDVAGYFAYFANGDPGDDAAIQVFDISDPSNPSLVGSFSIPGAVSDIVISDQYAYVCWHEFPSWDSNRLQIIDVADPTNPIFVSSYDDLDRPNSVFISGDYAYVADAWRGLEILDISDPMNPAYVSGYAHGCNSVVVSDGYAYVTAWDAGLLVIDVSEPMDPVLAGSYGVAGSCNRVVISGDHALLPWQTACSAFLEIVDIRDPTNPTFAAQYDLTPSAPAGISLSGAYAYLATTSGLLILDILTSAGPHPTFVGAYSPGQIRDLFVSAGHAYVAGRPRWTTSPPGGHAPSLHVVDISNPAAPAIVGNHNTLLDANHIFVAATYTYLVGPYLEIIDVSNPRNPVFAGSHHTPSAANAVFVSGNYAYVVGEYLGLQIIDVSDPSNTTLAGSCYVQQPLDIFVCDHFAYVTGLYAFQVVDVSDPSAPVLVASTDLPRWGCDLFVSDRYAYVTWAWGPGECGLTIYDISVPSDPVAVGTLQLYGYRPQDVFVADSYAYLATQWLGLLMVDISDPAHPTIAALYDNRGGSRSIFVADSYAYVADMGEWGSSLLTLLIDAQASMDEGASGPAGSHLVKTQPNPFTRRTTITYRSDIARYGWVNIFDTGGRMIRSFATTCPNGLLSWDGTDDYGHRVASGLYFVRLGGGHQVEQARVVLAR